MAGVDYRGRVVWITGASSGIGEALAMALAREGARLALSARREAELNRVADRCAASDGAGPRPLVVPLDVTDHAAMPAALARVTETHGPVDLLVNNAGLSQRSRCVDTDLSVYRTLIEVDLIGQIALTRTVLPSMRQRKSGHIAVTSSVAGKVGVPFRTGYCAAKHGVMGFFDALRAEVAADGIRVSTIVPGFVRTNISSAALSGSGERFGRTDRNIASGMDPDDAARVILRGLRRGRMEIAVGDGMEMHVLWLKRLFPGLTLRLANRLGGIEE